MLSIKGPTVPARPERARQRSPAVNATGEEGQGKQPAAYAVVSVRPLKLSLAFPKKQLIMLRREASRRPRQICESVGELDFLNRKHFVRLCPVLSRAGVLA